MLFFLILLIYFAVDWFLLNSINKRVIHTQNVTDIVYIVKLWKLFCCFLLFSTFQFFFNEYGVLSYFFSFARIYFIYFFFLYNIVLVLPYINMNLPWVYMCSPSRTPPTSPTFILSLWVIPVHQPRASCIMHRTWTGDLFHIWYYTYFNAILPNHPTLALSHRVQKTVLYICVFFAVLHTGLLLPSF